MMNILTHPVSKFLTLFVSFFLQNCNAMDLPIVNFPVQGYSQKVSDYLPPGKADYNKPLLTLEYQKSQLKQFYNHYYSTDSEGLSPWSANLIQYALPFIKEFEPVLIEQFNNQSKLSEGIHYGENFKVHDYSWWAKLKENMNLSAFNASVYKEENRAIATTNTHARLLPDTAPDFFQASKPGEGFPFDKLQASAIWRGTPLYVISLSKDKAWSLVITPDAYFAWVKSDDIAYVSPQFIESWQKAAKKGMVAVTQTQASILDKQGQFQFTGYIGAVFPLVQSNGLQIEFLYPVKHLNQAMAQIGILNGSASTIMPLIATPKNLAHIIEQLKNRPYGWGGAYFFNDCSQEVKSVFTPFGIWLPRSSDKMNKMESLEDLSNKNEEERIQGLKNKGRPLITLIYVDGHVMLYIGSHVMNNGQIAPMTYQAVWGLSPTNHETRFVIGQSLFLPILQLYPEVPDARSHATKLFFNLIYLDDIKPEAYSPKDFANKFFQENLLNIH